MARTYVYLEVSKYPHQTPWAYALFPCPLQLFLLTLLWVAYEVMNQIFIYYPSPDWSSAFCDRSRNVLSVAYMVHIRFACYPLPIRQSFSCPFFVRYLSVTYALLKHFMRSLHFPRRPSSPPRRISSPDEHLINNYCIFSVRSTSVTLIR